LIGVERKTLKMLIRQKGSSYRRLAEQLGATPSQISGWSTGKSEPGFSNAIRLARALDISLEELAEAMNLPKIDDPED
jgi:transcriptional regulator with XRE-family HTH domain